MFADAILKALQKDTKALVGTIASEEAARLENHPNLEEALSRRARREADRVGAQFLGLPQNLRFLTVYDFFDDYLSVAFEVQDRNQEKNWCCFWWDHPSVLHRVTAMWHKYEKLRLEDPAACDEEFLRYVVDHHMPILLGSLSPMCDCDRGKEHKQAMRLSSAQREVNDDE